MLITLKQFNLVTVKADIMSIALLQRALNSVLFSAWTKKDTEKAFLCPPMSVSAPAVYDANIKPRTAKLSNKDQWKVLSVQ